MAAVVVVVLAGAPGSGRRRLADEAVAVLRARGIDARALEAPPALDLAARLAPIEEAYGAMDAARATRLADALVAEAEGPAGASLSSGELVAVFARRALVARLASDAPGELSAVARLCAGQGPMPLPEDEYPQWLRDAAATECSLRAGLARAHLRVESRDPGAVVRIDGELVGPAPAEALVVPGRHVVHVVAEGVWPFGAGIDVHEGGAAVAADAEPDAASSAAAALRAGFSHRVLVHQGDGGILHLLVEDTTRPDGPPVLDLECAEATLDAGRIDRVSSAIEPPPPERPPRQRRRPVPPRSVPIWVWIAGGAALAAGAAVAILATTAETDEVRPVLEIRQP